MYARMHQNDLPTTAPSADTPPALRTMLVAAPVATALASVALMYTATAVGCACMHTNVLFICMYVCM